MRLIAKELLAQCSSRWDRLLDWIEKPWRREHALVGMLCEGSFYPTAWSGDSLPCIGGLSAPIKVSFWPAEVAVIEIVTATFRQNSPGAQRQIISLNIEDCGDLVMVSEGVPTMPAAAFAAKRGGHRVRWPHAARGVSLSVGFAIEPTVLRRIPPPDGFTTDDLVSVKIKAQVAVSGPRTR